MRMFSVNVMNSLYLRPSLLLFLTILLFAILGKNIVYVIIWLKYRTQMIWDHELIGMRPMRLQVSAAELGRHEANDLE